MFTTNNTAEPVPGLALRVRAALARVRNRIDAQDASEELLAVWEAAELAGYQAHRAGNYSAPLMIASDIWLFAGWTLGQHAAASFAELLACPHCRKLFDDDPCPVHGA